MKYWFVSLLLVFLSGCCTYPKVTYLDPAPTDSVRVWNTGWNAVAKVEIAPGFKSTLLISDEKSGDIAWDFSLHEGQFAKLATTHFIVTATQSNVRTVPISRITEHFVYDGIGSIREKSVTDSLEGGTYSVKGSFGKIHLGPRTFAFHAHYGESLPDIFDLHLPRLDLMGHVIEIEPIRYQRKTERLWQCILIGF